MLVRGRLPAVVAGAQCAAQVLAVDAVAVEREARHGEPDERRREIYVPGEGVVSPPARGIAGKTDEQRHVQQDATDGEAVIAVPAFGAELTELLAVVGREREHRAVEQAGAAEQADELVNPVVGVEDLPVVAVVGVGEARRVAEAVEAGVVVVGGVRVEGVDVEEERASDPCAHRR